MESRAEDLLHCEEQLKTTLHCNDKEKLRRKLAQLQREYLRTAQRLQRAEHLEAVRKHVRSRITPRDAEQTCNPPAEKSPPDTPTEDYGNSKRRQVIQFLLPSDAASPQAPDLDHVLQRGHRASPSLRLRSRRSRLRWEKRSAEEEDIKDTGNSHELSKTVGTGEEEDVNVSEELFSGSESESPSLLLSHWSSQGHGATGNNHGKGSLKIISEKEADRTNEGEEESTSLLTKGAIPVRTNEERHNNGTGSGREAECENIRDCLRVGEQPESICEKNSNTGKNEDKYVCNEAHVEKENKGMTEDKKSESLLDSCTLVEGLLFPVEYYVRTTRRMSSSLSQPDMQAVILSQLSSLRRSRSRGRARGRQRSIGERSHKDTRKDSVDSSTDPNQRSSEASGSSSTCTNGSDASVSSSLGTAEPPKGRRRKSRRGRGRPPSRRSAIDRPLSSKEFSTSLSPVVTAPAPVDANLPSSHCNDSQVSTGVNESPSSSGSKRPEKVYPMFMRSSMEVKAFSQSGSGTQSKQPLFPLPSSLATDLLSGLMDSVVQQDFHLPDNQFASLKLHKLRQVAVESGFKCFSFPSANTRNSFQRSHSCDPVTPHPLRPSLTPLVTISRHIEDKQQPTDPQKKETDTYKDLQSNSISPHSLSGVCAEDSCKYDSSDFLRNTVNDEPPPSLNHPLNELASKNQFDGQCLGEPVENPKSEDLELETLSLRCPPEEMAKASPAVQTTSHVGSPMESLNQKSSPEALQVEPEAATGQLHTKLLLSSPQASCIFTNSSPALPSLGLTPHVGPSILPVASPCSIPSLSLPPPHSPATLDLSPPPFSPCPSTSYIPPSFHPPSLTNLIRISPGGVDQWQRAGSANFPSPTNLPQQDTDGLRNPLRMKTTTLKAAAGGRLVDVCCVVDSSGCVCVAAAGKWAVCLWSEDSASEWRLIHTWTFDEPVINVFSVPDAAGLMCVTLGQLEIRAVRMLCCSTLKQTLLCEGVTQVAVGVSESRVVTSAPSAKGSTLLVFVLSESSSPLCSRPLVSPGVCVGALAPVDGLPHALLGTDENGHLFVWNLRGGQLLQRVYLGAELSLTACLRGYSHCGVLFVLLQHHFLNSLDEEEKDVRTEDEPSKEERKNALFSLMAVNPLTGTSVLASHLLPPKTWSGRLCEADVIRNSVVGLSQSGCVCVWKLERQGAGHVLWTPEGEGWQLARWGGENVLVTGQQNGDITLHQY